MVTVSVVAIVAITTVVIYKLTLDASAAGVGDSFKTIVAEMSSAYRKREYGLAASCFLLAMYRGGMWSGAIAVITCMWGAVIAICASPWLVDLIEAIGKLREILETPPAQKLPAAHLTDGFG